MPGESYLAVLDALADVRDRIQVIACRHEAGAANMAEAYGKLTGKPGVCMVTRGPGATHASIGVHTAHQDSTPMILFVGQIALTDRGRGAFQEVDYREVFGGLAKWATEIESPEPHRRGRRARLRHRPAGPDGAGGHRPARGHPARGRRSRPDPPRDARHGGAGPGLRRSRCARVCRRPNGPCWCWAAPAGPRRPPPPSATGPSGIGLPVALSFRRKDLILSNDRPNYAGDLGLGCNPELMKRAKDADLLIAIGARLGENPTQGYTLFDRARTAETLIHIHPGRRGTGPRLDAR